MVARPGQYQASLNAGELAPAVWGRSDIKQFYSGASLMRNAEPVPQGGWAELPGTVETGFVRQLLNPAAGATIYSPGATVGPALLAQANFTVQDIGVVDVLALSASLSIGSVVRVETSVDAVVWLPFGAPLNVTTQSRDYRVALPPGRGRRAGHVRLMLYVPLGAPATIAVSSMTVFAEFGGVVPARQFEHSYSIDDSFTVTVTPGHGDIWKGDAFVASIALPYTAQQIADLTGEQRLNTMLLFHPDVAPWRIIRRDGDGDWTAAPAPFVNVPFVDFGAAYVNIVPDQWSISLQWTTGPAGLILEIQVNGEDAVGVQLGTDWTAFATALKASIEALPSVQPGIIVTPSPPSGGAQYGSVSITFAGTGNAGQRFAVVPRVINVPWASATASHTQFGDPGGEEIMSPSRGYPAHGAFYQDRLFLAGFKAEMGALAGSVTGEYFDLNSKIENTAGGVLVRLDTRGAEQILYLAQMRHLILFTNEAEYYVSDRAILRGTPPNIAQSSRNGLARGVRPVESEGSLLYVGRSRSIIYAATYSDVSQSYESVPISLLASHLTQGVRGTALQRSSVSTDAARYWVVRDDGLMAVGVMIRNQDVVAFVRFVTDGLVRDVVVDGTNTPFLLIERVVGGQPRLLRERVSSDALLHQQRSFSFAGLSTQVFGLDSLEGVSVWAICDGYAEGPFTVTGGVLTVPNASAQITVGRWTPPIVDTLPLPRLVAERQQLARPCRVHTVRARLEGTTSLAIGANGQPPRDVSLTRAGQALDQPVPPFTGEVEKTGLFGYSAAGIVRFTQVRPGRFRVRDITLEART